MSLELKAPLQGQLRNQIEKEELQNKWDELSNFQVKFIIELLIYGFEDTRVMASFRIQNRTSVVSAVVS